MLIKHLEIYRELDMVDEMIATTKATFTISTMCYAGSDLEELEEYRSYLVHNMNSGHDIHRPQSIKNIITQQVLDFERDMK